MGHSPHRPVHGPTRYSCTVRDDREVVFFNYDREAVFFNYDREAVFFNYDREAVDELF
jgi:hypothetical protein